MCSLPCVHGECIVLDGTDSTINKRTIERCNCTDTLYSNQLCSFRNGLLYFELPLALLLIFLCIVFSLGFHESVIRLLRFNRSQEDDFVFPRTFQFTRKKIFKWIKNWIGIWKGPSQKEIPFITYRIHTKVFIGTAVAFELVPWVQTVAVTFLPIIPWHEDASAIAKFLRVFLVYPVWTHEKTGEYPGVAFYGSIGYIPSFLIVACLLGRKRFPLFKPQPKNAPPEDICSLMLRVYSEWSFIPILIMLLLPIQCLFVGYERQESIISLPFPEPTCGTWYQVGQMILAVAFFVLYWFISSGIVFQLNCESSSPIPTIWTDLRYTRLIQLARVVLALSIIAFHSSNQYMLCIAVITVSAPFAFLNLSMRPCIYSLVNNIRMYGSIIATWSGIIGLITAIKDDVVAPESYEIWSLGMIGITACTFSALFVHHTEEFWFKQASNFLQKSKKTTTGSTDDTTAIISNNNGNSQEKKVEEKKVV